MPRIPNRLLVAALKLYDRGFWVVPCNGKKAIVKAWDKNRLTKDELRKALKGTRLNIAIVLNQSKLIDVECDGDDAETNLKSLFGRKIPPTPTWQSKRGKHRLFRRPSGLPKRAKLEIDRIEFRIGNGKGTLSVVPPSVHESGVRYRWLSALGLDDVESAELPPEIVERLKGTDKPLVESKSDGDDIPEGKRNETLFKLGCRLRETGLNELSIAAALIIENEGRCKPPLTESEVRSIAKSAVKPEAGALTDAMTPWHTPDDTAYATIEVSGHGEHWPVGSARFGMFVRRHFYEMKGVSLSKYDLEKIIDHVLAMAIFDGESHPVFLRTAENEGRFYLDLANDSWSAVEIDADGWRVVANPPVRFRRTRGMGSLPLPEKGEIDDLRRFVNVRDDDMALVLA